MSIEDILSSNDYYLNIPRRGTITIKNRFLRVENIVYCPSRAIHANILKVSATDDVTIHFFAKGFPTCRFAASLLRLEKYNPYLERGSYTSKLRSLQVEDQYYTNCITIGKNNKVSKDRAKQSSGQKSAMKSARSTENITTPLMPKQPPSASTT